jgi:hypothetical protein
MLPGIKGSLFSHYFAEQLLGSAFAGRLGEMSRTQARERLNAWWRDHGSQLGPASSVRAVWDRVAVPLAAVLGFELAEGVPVSGDRMLGGVLCAGSVRIGVLLGHWSEDIGRLWREAVRAGLRLNARWCFCSNGHCLRVVDAQRTHSRFYVEFDLERAIDDVRTFAVLWGLLRAEAFEPSEDGLPPIFERALEMSSRHGAAVSRSLRVGVLNALDSLLDGLTRGPGRARRARPSHDELTAGFEESLTIVHRILFLLFAESRGLVPVWHPVYRSHYTIEALRQIVEDPGRPRGLWEALQAIARLAHDGCHAGTLIVPPFNGRLFATVRTPIADSRDVDDETARGALLALSTTPGERGAGRARIDYRDLGVEQLGAVYETVLEYEPAAGDPPQPAANVAGPAVRLRRGGNRRKATGSFYTPRSVTEYLVRRALHPLVDGANADAILSLKIVDPAMGSAAFLVAACRYLSRAYETALVRDGACRADEIGDSERAGFRRLVAQRCLFGVDLNPTAVQLARLSLWLATLSAGQPLTFLDHHLLAGDSLIGASLEDLARRPPPCGRRAARKPSALPLFDDQTLEPALRQVLPERARIAGSPDDSLDAVRDKEKRLNRLTGPAGPLHHWKSVADLWCACWLWPDAHPPGPGVFAALFDQVLRGRAVLPHHVADAVLKRARETAGRHRFFHWMLEFPEVYFAEDGRPLANPGFDAVIGNPPWDMIRADSGSQVDRDAARPGNAQIKRFVRESGIYRFQTDGQTNRYQLFLERAISLARQRGRIGLVLPSGLATDHGSSALRRMLIERCDVDALVGLDNRHAVFPIHRSVRFLLVTATAGARTNQIRCSLGIRDPAVLDTIPDTADRLTDPAYPVVLTPSLIERLSGHDLAVPELRSPVDLALVERIAASFPSLASSEGWSARFGRELNASDDRRHFERGPDGLPVLEGKHIEPFVVHADACTHRIPPSIAARVLNPGRTFRRARLAYRDVASATNRLTLIAAIVPPNVVTTHSLLCLKTPLSTEDQQFLCGILNSYVANYLVRLTITSHVTTGTIERLRAPKPPRESPLFQEIREIAAALARAPQAGGSGPRLQALVAEAYGLSLEEYRHVLGTFPLVDEEEKQAALEILRALRSGTRTG